MVNEKQTFIASDDCEGKRLDQFLVSCIPEISRSQIQQRIRESLVLVSDHVICQPNYRIKKGDVIILLRDESNKATLTAEPMPLEIIFEDDALMVINKPTGLVVHPGAGNRNRTLANAVLHHVRGIETVGETLRPGIVHRLDKDTSGLLVVAKTIVAHESLARQFKAHSTARVYYAVVSGIVQHDEGRCDAPIGPGRVFRKKMVAYASNAKEAITYFSVKERFSKATLLEVRLETGRTHQIRVHMAHLGYPILGDKTYGRVSASIKRQALHAKTLGFDHPVTGERMFFDSPLPKDFQELLLSLSSPL